MAKTSEPKKPRPKQYDDKLTVKGTFLDLVKATVKQSKDKTAAKKKEDSKL